MELLNISLSLNPDGSVSLDSVVGRDVSFTSYPGPDCMEILHAAAACVPSYAFNPASMVSHIDQAVLRAPALFGELSHHLQEVIEQRTERRQRQLSLFS